MDPRRGRAGQAPGALAAGLRHDELVAAVATALDGALPSRARVGVAVSGGADSAALALLVREARPDLALLAVHVRHGLRDDAADVAAAEGVAAHLGIPIEVRAADVGADGGPEAAARAARYAALRAVATDCDLAAVAVGHTAEDQAETVLLNLVRGAGLGGMGGMRATREVEGLVVLRPLLRLRREDVRAVPRTAGVEVVEDPTNTDPDQRRARARHHVLPALTALAGGPGDPVGALTRMAALAADDDAFLDEHAAAAASDLLRVMGGVRLLAAGELDALPRALARRVVRRAIASVRGGVDDLGAADVESALDTSHRVVVAGEIDVQRSQGWVVLRPAALRALPPRTVTEEGADLPELGAALVVQPARPAGRAGDARDAVGPAWLRGDHRLLLPDAPSGWTVRGAADGDAIIAGGRERALREVLRGAGVPRSLRRLLPVVVDATGAVRWVPGVVTADAPGARGAGEPAWALRLTHRLGYPPS